MRTVGEMMLITTDRYAYTVAGNNESNYRLVRVSTKMAGVGLYQMDELTSDVEGRPSILYFIGRDRLVYEWMPGAEANVISKPIQDSFNLALGLVGNYEVFRVHVMNVAGRLCVAVGGFIFDIANRTW